MPAKATKKTATTKAVAGKTQRYEYTELAKVSLASSDAHNVYGVVVDASFPYKQSTDLYICSLKIVDPSLHSKGAKPGDDDFATVVVYGKKFEALPILSKVGDIIRLHRATLRLYDGKRQFNVSTQWSGSWAVFDGEAGMTPTSYSGDRATFENHEKALIGSLRNWIGRHFGSHDGVTKDQYVALSGAKAQKKDFDVVAKVNSVHEMDPYTNELRLCDGTDVYYALALKLKFPQVRAGNVVYIRSATVETTSSKKKVLALAPHSNIMILGNNTKLASATAKKCTDTWAADKAELGKDVPAHAVVLSDVEKKHAGLTTTSLQDLFHNEGSLGGSTQRVCLNVVKVEGDVKEMCRVFDKKSKKSTSCKGGAKGDLIW